MSKKRERRVLGISFTPEFLSIFFKTGTIKITESPIPDDAEFLSAHYDHRRDMFTTHFFHSSFDPLVNGECIPFVDPSSIKYERTK